MTYTLTEDELYRKVLQMVEDFPGQVLNSDAFGEPHQFDFTEIFGFCGCGAPEEAAETLHTYLVACRPSLEETERKARFAVRVLQVFEQGGLGYVFAYWVDDRGWTDHGGAVTCAWLTESGERIVNALEVYLHFEGNA